LQERKLDLEFRNLDKDPLTIAELDALIGDRNYREFLNTRNELYRERKMKEHPPSRAEALKLMAAEPRLIRRPVVVLGEVVILGYDEKALKKLRQAAER
jgi:arsenate reductase